MTWPRFTIGELMTIVLYAAFGFAALMNADHVWADAAYTVAIISISTALLGAIVREGKARVPCIGFALFGWIYVLLDLLPSWTPSGFGFGHTTRPNLMIMWAIGRLAPYINRNPDISIYDRISYSLGMILFALIGAFSARVLAWKKDRQSP
jgi:hypothetical protein